MSLVTRCPACGTTFRVVPDQLRVSEGWVRCGRCEEVFDAQRDLRDDAGDAAPDVAAADPAPAPATAPAVIDSALDNATEPDVEAEEQPVALGAVLRMPDASEPYLAPVLEHPAGDEVAAADAEAPAAVPVLMPAPASTQSEDAPASDPPEMEPETWPELEPRSEPEPEANPDLPDPPPVMLREPEANATAPAPEEASAAMAAEGARLPTKRSRGWLLLGIVLAAAVLAGQVLRLHRDALAATQPALQPALARLCQWTACELNAVRRIDALRIDGSSFTPARAAGQYELSFALRNTAQVPVRMPAIDLVLLDFRAQAVLRRVLQPAEFGAPEQAAPGAEHTAQLRLALRPPAEANLPAVAGYSLFAFYP